MGKVLPFMYWLDQKQIIRTEYMEYQKRKPGYFLCQNTVEATLSAVSVSLNGEDAQYRIQNQPNQGSATYGYSFTRPTGNSFKNEIRKAKFSLQSDPTTRTRPVSNFAMCISFFAAKPCQYSAQFFVFISPLYFSAVNQKHDNMFT